MNDEHQLSIGYTYYFKETNTQVTPNIKVTLERFDNRIDLSNYLDNYGTYTYAFNVNDNNFNSFSTSVNFDIYIAKLTTSTSLDRDTNGGTAYTSLDEAISDSQNMTSQSYIYVYGDAVIGELDSALTLGANTELYLPHNANVTEWLDYNPSTGESNAALDVNNVQISSTITKYITITILEGTQLTVNGALTIGADRGQNAGSSGSGPIEADTRSGYSEVILEDYVQVIVYGSIWCYGYIRGTGEIIASSTDSSVSSIYEPFVITDWRGGTNAGGAYGGTGGGNDELNNLVPFNQYDMHHIEVKTTIKHGANLTGLAAIYTSDNALFSAQWNTTTYPIIGSSGILQLMTEDSYIIKDYDDGLDKTSLTIYGTVQDNPGKLSINVGFTLDLNTENLFFGISHNVKLIVSSGGTLNVGYKYKMLPGSSLEIKEGGTVNINQNGKLIVYKDWKDLNGGSQAYPTTYENPLLMINGTLNVTGYFAGTPQSENNGAVLNLTNAQSLEVTSNEGKFTGGFADLFLNPSATITSTQHLFATNIDYTNLSKTNYVFNGSMWVEGELLVSFDTNGYVDVSAMGVTNNFVLSQNNLPLGDNYYVTHNNVNYRFMGWYYNDQLVDNLTVTQNITLTAKWEVVEEKLYLITFTDVFGNQTVEYYTEGSTVTLPTQTYSETKIIYSNATTSKEYFIINGSAYTINGYNESGYEYGGEIVISSDINLTINFVKETNYYMIDIYKCDVDWKGSVSSTHETSIYMFKQNNLNINGLLGHACYDKPASSKLGWGWQFDWSSCSQTIDLNSNTSVYYG